jgi:hypothetical protein
VNVQKIRRNDPCPCGSGKKYKKCHLLNAEPPTTKTIPPHVIDRFRRIADERQQLQDLGIFVNYVKPVVFKGKKVWVLGSQVIFSPNERETFHDFILYVLINTLGKEWWDEQIGLPGQDRHFIVKCYLSLDRWKRDNASWASEVRPGVWELDPDGLGQYLLSLAFDIATLRHVATLPDGLLARLRHKDQYQGARYEVALAAIFARIDCEVTFPGREVVSAKHPEFIARFRPTGTVVAVEAKSRHRPGVLHQDGVPDEERAMRGDIARLLRDALRQHPGDQPFMIFIDLNSPLTPGVDVLNKSWAKDIRHLFDDYEVPTKENPDPMTLLCITNFSHHYQEGVPASGAEHLLIRSRFVRHDVEPELLDRLFTAIGNYGRVPNLDEEALSA